MRIGKQLSRCFALCAVVVSCWSGLALAAQSASTNYQVNEVFIGSGGELNACSTNYCSKQAAGELGVGNTASANFQSQGGFNTDRTPYIQLIVSNTNLDLGTLSSGSTKTANATFSVKSYLSSGYNVVTVSSPPTNGAYTMNALSSPTASSAGTEQFGMNLVANTSPTTFGANATQSPDNTFSFGTVASGYNTANLYKYVKNDIIASSTKSSGTTNYTLSYIFNVSNLTPGGSYTFNEVLVASATF